MKYLRKYIRLLVEKEQLSIPFPDPPQYGPEEGKNQREQWETKAAEEEKLVTAFLDNAMHGLHLAQSVESSLAEEFEELRENALFLIELVEDKSNLQVWGGYQYQDQQQIQRVGRQIQDDLLYLPGVTKDHPLWKIVDRIHMGCTNKAKDVYCVENTEALKDWVGMT